MDQVGELNMTIIGNPPNPELERLNLETLAQSQIIAQKNKEISELRDRVKWLEEHWAAAEQHFPKPSAEDIRRARVLAEDVRGASQSYKEALAAAPTAPTQREVEPELVRLAEYDPEKLYGKKQSKFWKRFLMVMIPGLVLMLIVYELKIHGF
jgi:hypothetical protein